jgi:hypothetical protein
MEYHYEDIVGAVSLCIAAFWTAISLAICYYQHRYETDQAHHTLIQLLENRIKVWLCAGQ